MSIAYLDSFSTLFLQKYLVEGGVLPPSDGKDEKQKSESESQEYQKIFKRMNGSSTNVDGSELSDDQLKQLKESRGRWELSYLDGNNLHIVAFFVVFLIPFFQSFHILCFQLTTYTGHLRLRGKTCLDLKHTSMKYISSFHPNLMYICAFCIIKTLS